MKSILAIMFFLVTTLPALSQDKNELLLKAAADGDQKTVSKLLKDGADVNYVKEVGPWMKMNPLISSITNGHFEISKLLIAKKADVNWKDGFKTSAILYAAHSGNKELVELLLSHGADINDHDGQGNTVLTAARESKNKEMIKFVTEKINGDK